MQIITYLNVIDQLRYIIGMIAALFLFFHNAVPKREHFRVRLVAGLTVCFFTSTGYLGLLWSFQNIKDREIYFILSIFYWIGMMFFLVGFMMFCYHISFGHALFRGLMGVASEGMVTTFLVYTLVKLCLPKLPEEHTILYILLAVASYLFFYGLIYQVLAKRIQDIKLEELLNNRKTVRIYTVLLIFYSLINDASRGIAEWIMKPIVENGQWDTIVFTIQIYTVGVNLLLCTFILLYQYYVYEVIVLQNEKHLFQRLLMERKSQYEHSKDMIDIINQKCHELKKKIIDLERMSESERSDKIKETKKAVMFYDSVVKTSNEVLNTVLTEKSLYCANRNINLTCMANAEHLSDIDGVDLYTILENGLDHAISCAEKLRAKEKKVVAISIYECGKILYMAIENYYEKTVPMQNGSKMGMKKERENYDMGLQTIRMVAKKYGGDIRIIMEDEIFILQVILPFFD